MSYQKKWCHLNCTYCTCPIFSINIMERITKEEKDEKHGQLGESRQLPQESVPAGGHVRNGAVNKQTLVLTSQTKSY